MASATGNSHEQLLISSVLINRDWQAVVSANVTGDMFRGYKAEYEWLERYYNRHHRMPTKAAFSNANPGFAFIKCDDTAHFCEEVKRMHAKRSMLAIMKTASETLVGGNVDDAIKMLSRGALEVASSIGVWNDDDALQYFDDVLATAEDTVARVAETGSAGIPLGFDSYDARTGGLKPGELIGVGARQGEGKSWLLIKAAVSALRAGKCVVIDSLEMTKEQMMYRIYNMLALEGGYTLKNTDIMSGVNFDLGDLRRFMANIKAHFEATGAALHITASSNVTPLTVAAQIERRNPDLVLIDYLQIMRTDGMKDWASVGANIEALKALALDAKIAMMVASQMNREAGVTKPGMPPGTEAFALSDVIGNTVDTAITMSRGSARTNVIRVPKNRHGAPDFRFYTEFDPTHGNYREITKTAYDNLIDADTDEARNPNPPAIVHKPATDGGMSVVPITREAVQRAFSRAGKRPGASSPTTGSVRRSVKRSGGLAAPDQPLINAAGEYTPSEARTTADGA